MGFFHRSMFFIGLIVLLLIFDHSQGHSVSITQLSEENSYVSVVGDPGMKSPNARFALEAWNFCNEVGMEAPNMGSPRMADCADLYCPNMTGLLQVQLFQFSANYISQSKYDAVFMYS